MSCRSDNGLLIKTPLCLFLRLLPVSFWAVLVFSGDISVAEQFTREEPVIVVNPLGWDGASLPFEYHQERLIVWQCRARCGTLDIVRMKSVAFVDGCQQPLAEVSGHIVAGGAGTLYVVRSERSKRESRGKEGLVAIGFAFESIERNNAVLAPNVAENRTMVRFIAAREEFRCGIGEEKMLCVFLFGSGTEPAGEHERVSDAAARGDLVKVFDVAKSCKQTSVVIVFVTAE
jgi:hypothetical protein